MQVGARVDVSLISWPRGGAWSTRRLSARQLRDAARRPSLPAGLEHHALPRPRARLTRTMRSLISGVPGEQGCGGRRLTPRSVFRETLLSVRPSQKPCGCSLCPSAGEQGSRRQRLAPVCTLQSPAALSKPCTKSPGAQEHKSQLTRVSTSVAKGPGQCVLFDFLIHRGSREGASV